MSQNLEQALGLTGVEVSCQKQVLYFIKINILGHVKVFHCTYEVTALIHQDVHLYVSLCLCVCVQSVETA